MTQFWGKGPQYQKVERGGFRGIQKTFEGIRVIEKVEEYCLRCTIDGRMLHLSTPFFVLQFPFLP